MARKRTRNEADKTRNGPQKIRDSHIVGNPGELSAFLPAQERI
jgi:hypothetical protein